MTNTQGAKAKLLKICKWIVPLLLGILLFWLVYRKMDMASVWGILSQGLRWEWVAICCFLYTISMTIRGLRWQLLLDPVCPGGRLRTTVLSAFIAYGANLLFPRIGEVARCGVLKKYDGLHFSTSLGTVVTERVFDIICLILMALAALVMQVEPFRNFLTENPSAGEKWMNMLFSWKLWIALGFFTAICIIAVRLLKNRPVWQKIKTFALQMWQGMLSIRTLKHPWLFILYTLLLWGSYYMSFYLAQYLFNVPLGLSFVAMFTAYVMGNFGVVAPVQGGIGAWHFMVIFTLTFYGIGQTEAGAFALIVHGLNTLFTAISGLVAWGWVAIAGQRTGTRPGKIV